MSEAEGRSQFRVTARSEALTPNPVGAAGASSTDPLRVKVNWAMCSPVNFPRPRMLVMTPRGFVEGLLSENSVPFSVPASQG